MPGKGALKHEPGAGGSVNLMLTRTRTDRASRRLDPTTTPASPPLLRGAGARRAATLGGYRAGRLLNLRKRPFVGAEPEWFLRVDYGLTVAMLADAHANDRCRAMFRAGVGQKPPLGATAQFASKRSLQRVSTEVSPFGSKAIPESSDTKERRIQVRAGRQLGREACHFRGPMAACHSPGAAASASPRHFGIQYSVPAFMSGTRMNLPSPESPISAAD